MGSNSAAEAICSVRAAGLALGRGLDRLFETELSSADAAMLAGTLGTIERRCRAAKLRAVLAVDDHQGGHVGRHAFLAGLDGSSVGSARGALSFAESMRKVPVLQDAFDAGEVSESEAKVILRAAKANAKAAERLLSDRRSFAETKEEADRIVRVADGESTLEQREARAHANRSLRLSPHEGGGMRLSGMCSKVQGARIKAALERQAKAIFDEHRASGDYESHDAYLLDALERLGDRAMVASGGRPRETLVVRTDVEALRRGWVEGEETCEIPGVGPVPVRVATSVLGDAWLTLVVTKGTDVATIVNESRYIPDALAAALECRDPICVVPGCPNAYGLERDHWETDFVAGGPTCLENLARLCRHHHAMKTNLKWRLAGGPGQWEWLPPSPRVERRE